MTISASAPWRRRLSELGRGVGKPHPPLFAPLLYGVASQIEALSPAEVTADPTLLGKCLVELRRALATSPFVTAAPTAMEAEALGARVDRDAWPPRVVGPAPDDVLDRGDFDDAWGRSEALAASLEVTKRLASSQPGEPVLLAALTGPASLLRELLGDEARMDGDAFEFAGRVLSALSRRFAEAGVSAIVLCEREAPADAASFAAALNTIANVARFHRIPALLAFCADGPAAWPPATIACPPTSSERSIAKPHGLVVPPDPERWGDIVGHTGGARIVVTASEVAAGTAIESLSRACERALAIERESP